MANNDARSSAGSRPRPVETPRIPLVAKPPSPVDDGDNKIAEADALALFIARRGNMLGDDAARKEAYKDLKDAIAAAKAGKDENLNALLAAYAGVSAFTYAEHGVNGRTILDTDDKGEYGTESGRKPAGGAGLANLIYRLQRPRNRPLLIGGTLLFFVAVFEGILLITGGDPARTETHGTLVNAKELMRPLVWGAIGTCIYLMKKLSDRLSEFSFEESRARGMGTRVFLGAVLGLVVVEMVKDQLGNPPTFPIYLIAFLAGLGIKPVYAAIESVVEGLAARIKLPTQSGKS